MVEPKSSPLDIGGQKSEENALDVIQRLFQQGFCGPKKRFCAEENVAENNAQKPIVKSYDNHSSTSLASSSDNASCSQDEPVHSSEPDEDGGSVTSTDSCTPVKSPTNSLDDRATVSSKIPPELRQRLEYEPKASCSIQYKSTNTHSGRFVEPMACVVLVLLVLGWCSTQVVFTSKTSIDSVVPTNASSSVEEESPENVAETKNNVSETPLLMKKEVVHEPMPSQENMMSTMLSVDWMQELLEQDLVQKILSEPMPSSDNMVASTLSVDWMQELLEQDLVEQVVSEALDKEERQEEQTYTSLVMKGFSAAGDLAMAFALGIVVYYYITVAVDLFRA